jgi:hypothetical protein
MPGTIPIPIVRPDVPFVVFAAGVRPDVRRTSVAGNLTDNALACVPQFICELDRRVIPLYLGEPVDTLMKRGDPEPKTNRIIDETLPLD